MRAVGIAIHIGNKTCDGVVTSALNAQSVLIAQAAVGHGDGCGTDHSHIYTWQVRSDAQVIAAHGHGCATSR